MLRAERSGHHEDSAWDTFVARHPHGHLLQSSAWGRFRSNWGWETDRVVVRDEADRIVAGAQAQIRATPVGQITYVPRGPVCAPADPAWSHLRTALENMSRSGLALRLEPHWADEGVTREWLVSEKLVEAEPVQPASTIRLDLTKSEDDLLSGMKQKWRYNVRLATRRGVEVTEGDQSDSDEFGRLMAVTAERDGFGVRPLAYFSDAKRHFGEDSHLYIARRGSELLAGVMVFHFGDCATYLYGASSDGGRRHMPNHLLQWEAIKRAKAAGLACYDFWGIPDALGRAVVAGEEPDQVPPEQGGLWGVWGFKRGFGGQVHRSVGAWDLVQSPVLYRAALAVASLRRRLAGGD